MIRSAIATACFLVCAAGASAADKDIEKLQGVWNVVSSEVDGTAVPDESAKRMRLTFKGDKLIVKDWYGDDREDACTYKVDSTKSPKTLDITPARHRDLTRFIYELNGDNLKVCMFNKSPSTEYPKEFTSKNKQSLMILKRVK